MQNLAVGSAMADDEFKVWSLIVAFFSFVFDLREMRSLGRRFLIGFEIEWQFTAQNNRDTMFDERHRNEDVADVYNSAFRRNIDIRVVLGLRMEP